MPEVQEDGTTWTWIPTQDYAMFESAVLNHFAGYLNDAEFSALMSAIDDDGSGSMRSHFDTYSKDGVVRIQIINMFIWSSTPEGLHYWADIHSRTPGILIDPLKLETRVLSDSA